MMTTKPKLKIFNYVYYGYVISPYNFMSAFTTDFLRANRPVFVNDPIEF